MRKPFLFFGLALLILTLWSRPVLAAAGIRLVAPSKVTIGQPFLIKVVSDRPMEAVTIKWMGHKVKLPVAVSSEGSAAVMILGADIKDAQTGQRSLTASVWVKGQEHILQRSISLLQKKYPEERLKVDPSLVTPPAEALERIKNEVAAVTKALATVTSESRWAIPFNRPVPGKVLSTYALRRVYNNKPGAYHRGLDFAAGAGEPIKAAQSGRVILVGDHYFAGKSVYLDHGLGVITVYFHMSEILVREGQVVDGGDTIGRVGSTGRSTGPHLHYGLYVLGQGLDPTPLFDKKFGTHE